MKTDTPTPCFCNALRQASRAVSRLYDEELRGVGLRTTQYSLLRVLAVRARSVRATWAAWPVLDETTLTRNLRPLVDAGWVAIRSGEPIGARSGSRSPKWERPSWRNHGPAWERAQGRMQGLLPDGTWQGLMECSRTSPAHRRRLIFLP